MLLVPCRKTGQYKIPQTIEVLLVAKEVSLSDRDRGDQRVQFGGAAQGFAKHIEVVFAIPQSQACQTAADTVREFGVFVLVISQARRSQHMLLEARIQRIRD